MPKLGWMLAAAALAITLFAAACSDDNKDTDSPTEATSALCTDIASLKTAGASLIGSRSIDDAKTAVASIDTSAQQVKGGVQDARTARVDALEQSVDVLKTSVASIPGSDSITGAVATLQPGVAAVRTAAAQVGTSANCK